jgi:dephospho-CoA kinase
MIVIGLVGRIGAGKSTVARLFADLGAEVVDADAVAHEVLDEPEVRAAVVARFGAGVVGAEGRVSRAALAAQVFGPTPEQAAALADLEAIVHPPVRQRITARLAAGRAAERADGRPRVVVLDVPLLVHGGWDAACDRIVRVECEDSVRRARLVARGWSETQIAGRDRAWERTGGGPLPAAKTVTVDTARDPAYTRREVERIWATLRSR